MKRRAFCTGAGALALFGRNNSALAQPKPTPVLIGWLNTGSRNAYLHRLRAFEEGLSDVGWKQGQHYVLEERWADAQAQRLRSLADELSARKPAVIVAATSPAVEAAAKAAPNVPVVMVVGGDPVASGFAKSLSRPGGMITGLTNVTTETSEKYLELLLAAVPGLKKVGLFFDAKGINTPAHKAAVGRALSQYRVDAVSSDVARPEEIEAALARIAKAGARGLIVFPSSFFPSERRRIMRAALEHRLAVIANAPEFAEEGALLTYGADPTSLYRRAAFYVHRILRGTPAGDLPIEAPTQFELVVNLKTAKGLGLNVPQELSLRAHKVIE